MSGAGTQPVQPPVAAAPSGDVARTQAELLTALERLGDLFQKGILTEGEFQAKKAELLSRI